MIDADMSIVMTAVATLVTVVKSIPNNNGVLINPISSLKCRQMCGTCCKK